MTDHVKDFEHAGFACYTRVGGMGIKCGYVVLPDGHPWNGKGYDELLDDTDVHGGLTYSNHHDDDGEGTWTVGFDCGHCDDVVPALGHTWEGASPKGWDYVEQQCKSLADQARRATR